YWNIDLAPGGTGVTTIMGTSQDDVSLQFDLGADVFRFYGTNYTGGNQLYVSSNGMITFGSANSSLSNTALASGPAQAAIAPFWDDMITDATTGAVLAKKVDVDGNGINDYLIIEWNDIHHWANPVPPAKGMFQTILALNTGSNNGDVVFNYQGTT